MDPCHITIPYIHTKRKKKIKKLYGGFQMTLHFYHCDICGKTAVLIDDTDIPTYCCGKPMTEMTENHTDGVADKHLPVYTDSYGTVSVRIGSELHPMKDNHYISWIGLRTNQGFRLKELHPGSRPEAVFFLDPGDRVEAVYAFCNLHGLWCAEKGGLNAGR